MKILQSYTSLSRPLLTSLVFASLVFVGFSAENECVIKCETESENELCMPSCSCPHKPGDEDDNSTCVNCEWLRLPSDHLCSYNSDMFIAHSNCESDLVRVNRFKAIFWFLFAPYLIFVFFISVGLIAQIIYIYAQIILHCCCHRNEEEGPRSCNRHCFSVIQKWTLQTIGWLFFFH